LQRQDKKPKKEGTKKASTDRSEGASESSWAKGEKGKKRIEKYRGVKREKKRILNSNPMRKGDPRDRKLQLEIRGAGNRREVENAKPLRYVHPFQESDKKKARK